MGRPLARVLVAACGLMVFLNASAQSASSTADMARDLAARIATAVAPLQELHLDVIDRDPQSASAGRAVAAELTTQLRAHNIRVITAPSPPDPRRPEVRLICSANLRDQVCSAEIRKADAREVTIVSRARGDGPAPPPLVTLDVRPVFAQRLPILDLAIAGERLLVLDVAAVAVYERAQPGWRATATAALPTNRPWPRDARGRLWTDGAALSVFLPGVSCRGSIDPLALTCAEGNEPWPIGVPAATVAAGANCFTSPKTPSFFTAAPFGQGGDSGWLLAATDGRLLVLDQSLDTRQSLPGIGDDIASISTPCAAGRQVIAAIPDRDAAAGDGIRAYDVSRHELVSVTPVMSMPGRVTALWETPGTPFALVVVHNPNSGRYEAFHVGMSCAR